MLNSPFSPWPDFTDEEAAAVNSVLLSNKVNYWTGQEGRKFETEFAAHTGVKHAVALANGTVAIDLALNALSLCEGDEVIVTSRTFLASASCIINAGATPIFADVDRDSQNITPASIEAVLSQETKAIICVHLAGWPCEMDGVLELASRHDLAVIEDCAQAHGALYKDKPVGSFGDLGTWSFCQDKIMTTGGEGGMVTTNNRNHWKHIWSGKDHGRSFEAVYEREHPPGFRWLSESFGTNARLTEMQSAIGRIQITRMPHWHRRRLEIARRIWAFSSQLPGLRVPAVPDHIEHAAYKCYVFVRPTDLRAGWDRDRVIAEITALGIPCNTGSCSEVYLEKAFVETGYRPMNRLPVARELGETSLVFLCHPTLTDDEVEKTCEVLKTVMHRATG